MAAARNGAQTLLVERHGSGGGMATAGLVGPFMTSYSKSGDKMIIRGMFEEVINRLLEQGGAVHPQECHLGDQITGYHFRGHDHCSAFEPEVLKRVIDEMLTEADVKILYHTTFVKPLLEGNRMQGGHRSFQERPSCHPGQGCYRLQRRCGRSIPCRRPLWAWRFPAERHAAGHHVFPHWQRGHAAAGTSGTKYVCVEKGEWYGVPYRCLVPVQIDQLLVAGRTLSATSEGAGAVRVMPPCMEMGHAAGVSAAMAVQNDCLVRNIDIKALQAQLVKEGTFLD